MARRAPPRAPHDAVGDPQPRQQRAPRCTVVSLVTVYALLVAADQRVADCALIDLGPGQNRLAHQARARIHSRVRLVAEVIVALAAVFARTPLSVRVLRRTGARRDRALGPGRR